MNFPISSSTVAGLKNERRFADAIGDFHPNEPSWFLGLDGSSPLLDLRGIDFIAWVKYPHRRRPMPVPVQIKSSEEGKERYFETHPAAKAAGTIVMVLRPRDSAGTIRGRFFTELSAVRMNGTPYEEYLEKLLGNRVSMRGQEKLRIIEAQRMHMTKSRAKTKAPPPSSRKLHFLPPELTPFERLYYRARRIIRALLAPRGSRPHAEERTAA